MWTRNYKNLIMTTIGVSADGGAGSGSTSGYSFGEGNYFANYKNQYGSVYDIRTQITSNSYATRTSRPVFCKKANSGSLTAYCSFLTSRSSTPDSQAGDSVYIQLGSSNTPATEMDYQVESIISNFSAAKASASVTRNDDGTNTISYNLIVQATADITVAEIGLFLPFFRYVATSNSEKYGDYVLINRIVLDEAVSVASGQTASIQFSVTTPKVTFA